MRLSSLFWCWSYPGETSFFPFPALIYIYTCHSESSLLPPFPRLFLSRWEFTPYPHTFPVPVQVRVHPPPTHIPFLYLSRWEFTPSPSPTFLYLSRWEFTPHPPTFRLPVKVRVHPLPPHLSCTCPGESSPPTPTPFLYLSRWEFTPYPHTFPVPVQVRVHPLPPHLSCTCPGESSPPTHAPFLYLSRWEFTPYPHTFPVPVQVRVHPLPPHLSCTCPGESSPPTHTPFLYLSRWEFTPYPNTFPVPVQVRVHPPPPAPHLSCTCQGESSLPTPFPAIVSVQVRVHHHPLPPHALSCGNSRLGESSFCPFSVTSPVQVQVHFLSLYWDNTQPHSSSFFPFPSFLPSIVPLQVRMRSSPFPWPCPSESVQRMAGTTPSCLLTSVALLCQLHQLLSPLTQTDSTQQTNSTPNTRESPACTNRALPAAPVTFPTDTDWQHTTDQQYTQHQGKSSMHQQSFTSCTSYFPHWHRHKAHNGPNTQHRGRPSLHLSSLTQTQSTQWTQHPTPGKAQPAPVFTDTDTKHTMDPTPNTGEGPACTCLHWHRHKAHNGPNTQHRGRPSLHLSSLTQTAHHGPAPNTGESPACTCGALPDAPVTVFTDTDSTSWTSTQHRGKPSLHLWSFARCTSYCLHWHRQHIMDQHPTPGKAQSAPVELCQMHQLLSSLTQTAHHGPAPNTRESPVCTWRALPDAPVTFPTDEDSTSWTSTQHQGKPSLHL